jgi:anti-sigma B factor antagonist
VKVRKVGDVFVVAPSGWLMGGDETDAFEAVIRKLFADGNRRLVVNLADVATMNSLAIGTLMGCRQTYVNRDGQIALCGLGRRLSQVFSVTKLVRVFDIHVSEDDALEALSPPARSVGNGR